MTRRTSRRDFLRVMPAPGAGRDDPSPPAPRAAATEEARRPYLLDISRSAMACRFEVLLNAGQYANAAEAAIEALDVVDALEDELSFFRPASRISRLNLVAADGPVEVDAPLFGLLELAVELHRETAGAFDVTSAPLWEAWGFARREGKIPSAESLAEAMQLVGSGHLKLDAEKRTVQFTKPGLRLNLGSIGKGYALDRAAEALVAAGIGDFLFHGGQSSVLARGSRGDEDAAAGRRSPGWSVGIRDPLRPKRRLAEIRLRDRALGTSGSTMQYFRSRGRRYAHILDPRTGQPAEGVLSVTVVAPTAVLADGLSTAMFVMGPERARELCARQPELAALFVCPAGASGREEIHAIGFGEDELTLFDDG
jgi:thiamine biosynthesis lipoprotein